MVSDKIRLRLQQLAHVATSKFSQRLSLIASANAFIAFVSLAHGVIVARLLEPASYGILSLIMSYPDLVYAILDARMADASIKYLSKFHGRERPLSALAMCKLGYAIDFSISTISFSFIVFTASIAETHIVHQPHTSPLIVLYGVALFPRALIGTSRSVLMVLDRYSKLAYIDGITAVLRAVVGIGLVLAGYGVEGLIWAQVIGAAFGGAAFGFAAHQQGRKTWGQSWLAAPWSFLSGSWKEIIRFIFFTDLNALFALAMKQLEIPLLGYFRTSEEVGYYRLAKSFSRLTSYVAMPLQSVTYPHLAMSWSSAGAVETRRLVRKLALLVGVPIGVLGLIGVVVIPHILVLVAGDAYEQSALPAQVLLLSGTIGLFLFWLRPLYLVSGHERDWAWATLFSSLGFLIFAIPATVSAGPIGLAMVFFATNLIAASVCAYRIWRRVLGSVP